MSIRRPSAAAALAGLAALALSCLAAAPLARRACAEDPPPPGMDPGMGGGPADGRPEPEGVKAPPPPRAIPDAEAAPLIEGLKKAIRTRNSVEAMPALAAIAGVTNPGFEPHLVKLMSHLSVDIAVKATECLAERPSEKLAATLWRSGWLAPINDKRDAVKGTILAAYGRLGAKLDAKQYDEVESLWRRAPSAEILTGIARYFEAVKTDKRPCRLLAEFLDEPRAGDVNSGTNPPASYWEARWKLWNAVQPHVVDALHAITGETFHTTKDAKAWFEAKVKTFGFRW